MYALPVQNTAHTATELNAWFQYGSSQQDGYSRLRNFLFSQAGTVFGSKARSEFDFQPLSPIEEGRWKVLERKAKQENLSGNDAAEHEVLLAVQFYHRLKREEPQLSHMELLEIIQHAL